MSATAIRAAIIAAVVALSACSPSSETAPVTAGDPAATSTTDAPAQQTTTTVAGTADTNAPTTTTGAVRPPTEPAVVAAFCERARSTAINLAALNSSDPDPVASAGRYQATAEAVAALAVDAPHEIAGHLNILAYQLSATVGELASVPRTPGDEQTAAYNSAIRGLVTNPVYTASAGDADTYLINTCQTSLGR